MNRRGFLGSLAAFVAAPFVPWSAPAVSQLTFKGIPLVADNGLPVMTMIGIDRATYSFWRDAQPHQPHYSDSLRATMRQIYDRCESMDARG